MNEFLDLLIVKSLTKMNMSIRIRILILFILVDFIIIIQQLIVNGNLFLK